MAGRGGKRPGAGRKKNGTNGAKMAFRAELRAYCDRLGVDPHKFMAEMIANTEEIVYGIDAMGAPVKGPAVKPELKFNAAKELAQYLEPRLKSVDVEVSGNADKPLIVRVRRAH